MLIQCALAAVKSKKEPYFAIKYQRLAKRRGKKKAIIALVHPQRPEKVTLTLDNALQFLREQGTDPETLKLKQQQCAAQAG